MKLYTDKALETIRENTNRLYAKLASTKPTEAITRDDIRDIMYYLKAFESEAKSEQYRREMKKHGVK